MDERLVYSKTSKGVAEVAARGAALSLAARRILIMVDGKRTVGGLGVLLKPGEIDGVLTTLESQGFIVRSGGESSPRQGPSTRGLDAPTSGGPLDVNTV